MNLTKNISASVRQRLLNRSKENHRSFNEILQYYAMERFLYRLSKSPFSNRFVLKGALLMRVWGSPEIRPTMDIDLLGKTRNDKETIAAQFREIMVMEATPDGIKFLPDSLRTEDISEDAKYSGVRILFEGRLDTAKLQLQIDIGFGDVAFPAPKMASLPTMLDQEEASLLCYSRESAIAEKFEAMIQLGRLNSRMKDFYDIWILARNFDFDAPTLTEAIRQTFQQRETDLPEEIEAFTEPFAAMKQVQWVAFRKRLQSDRVPPSFKEILEVIEAFLGPIVAAVRTRRTLDSVWRPPGPWV